MGKLIWKASGLLLGPGVGKYVTILICWGSWLLKKCLWLLRRLWNNSPTNQRMKHLYLPGGAGSAWPLVCLHGNQSEAPSLCIPCERGSCDYCPPHCCGRLHGGHGHHRHRGGQHCDRHRGGLCGPRFDRDAPRGHLDDDRPGARCRHRDGLEHWGPPCCGAAAAPEYWSSSAEVPSENWSK